MIGKVKKNARLLLRGNLAKGAAITLVLAGVVLLFKGVETVCLLILDMLGISAAAQGIGGLSDILSILPLLPPIPIATTVIVVLLGSLVLAPLYVGIKSWYFELSGGKKCSVSEIFEPFSHARTLFRSWFLLIDVFLRSFFWVYLCVLPGALLGTTGFALLTARLALENGELIGTLAVGLGVVLGLLGLIIGVVTALRYSLAPYLYAEDMTRSARFCIRTSVRYMHGSHGRMLGLLCSFLPWALFSVLVLPALYAFPYAQASVAIFARYLIQKGRYEDGEKTDSTKSANIIDDTEGTVAADILEEPVAPEPQNEPDSSDTGSNKRT